MVVVRAVEMVGAATEEVAKVAEVKEYGVWWGREAVDAVGEGGGGEGGGGDGGGDGGGGEVVAARVVVGKEG